MATSDDAVGKVVAMPRHYLPSLGDISVHIEVPPY